MEDRSDMLLRVVSTLFIIGGTIELILVLAGAIGSVALGVTSGSTGLGVILMLTFLIPGVGAVVELVADILGSRRRFRQARVWVVVSLALCILALIFEVISGSFSWSTLARLVLPILFLVGYDRLQV